jgi:Uma2 family endonuclease
VNGSSVQHPLKVAADYRVRVSAMIQFTQAYYPESDGKPMGETDEHRQEMVRHIELLEDFFRGQCVYVSGNLLVYYEQGNPRRFIVPDAFVVKGVTPRKRRVYKVWAEGKAPDVIIETTSRKTRRKDTVDKPRLYAQLGVSEYFIFDPDREYLEPPLQGYRLAGNEYSRIETDSTGSLLSQQLGLRLCVGEMVLQFFRIDTGERLLNRDERATREAERADREAEARQRESERADREAQARQAEAQARQAEAQARLAEAQARQAAELEVARLRAELARRPQG